MVTNYVLGKVRQSGNVFIVTVPKGTIPLGHHVKIIDIETEIENASL